MTDYLQKYELEEWCQELNKIVDENNQLRKENEQLKREVKRLKCINKQLEEEKNYWKSACAKSDNENVILKKELLNTMEQGYELSNSYSEYLEERKKDMLKHYSDKRRIKKRTLI